MNRLIFLAAWFCYSMIDVNAQTIYFTGTTNNDWNNASNWNPSRIPDATDEVEIGNTSHAIIYASPPTIKSLTIRANGKLTVNSSQELYIDGAPTIGLHLLLSADLINNGIIRILNSQVNGVYVEDTGSSIINNGELSVQGFGNIGFYFKEAVSITNNAILFVNQFYSPGNICFQAEGGVFTNSSSGEFLINWCSTSNASPLQIAHGVSFSNQGTIQFLTGPNCN